MDTFYRSLVSIGFTDPVHPVFNHLPIGLVVAALVFGIISLIFRGHLPATARYSVILALLAAVPTAFFGILDWQHYYAGAWISPVRMKVILAAIFVGLLFTAILLAARGFRAAVLFIYILLVVNVFWLGFYGGQLVFGGRAPVVAQHREGAFIFRGNCLGCHPYGGNILTPQHAPRGSRLLEDQAAFVRWIRNPMAPMPPFPPAEIPDPEAARLFAYMQFMFGGHHD
jgi:uncharacterized membrane protein